MELVDKTRNDPFAPDQRPRIIMVSVFYPVAHGSACHPQNVDYMPPATAQFEDQAFASYGVPNGTFESLRISTCRSKDSICTTRSRCSGYPLVLFSPGLGASRLLYSGIAQGVASSGYIVVTIDHPYDADVVELTNGTLILAANISTSAQIELAVSTRAQDASFVLDQLSSVDIAERLVPGAAACGGVNTSHVAMFGHSLGGATTAVAMLHDPRIAGGLNMDGSFYFRSADANKTLNRPFLIFENQNHTRQSDPTWAEFWPRLTAWKRELRLAQSQHDTFTDFPLLVRITGLVDSLGPQLGEILGTLDGTRVLEIVETYVAAFVDFVMTGKLPSVLKGPSVLYPEVTFVT